jgi:hypothetical protein
MCFVKANKNHLKEEWTINKRAELDYLQETTNSKRGQWFLVQKVSFYI